MSANPNLAPATRAERAVEAARLRDEEGLNGIQIAERMGIARSYAYELLTDPEGNASRKRKEKYAGTCVRCGGKTSYGVVTPSLCGTCATEPYWTRERVIEAIRTWADEHGGIPPRSLDWGNGTAQRHPDHRTGEQPFASTCQHVFGSFNAALEAAGFEPHRRRDRDRFNAEALARICDRLRRGETTQAVAESVGTNVANLCEALHRRGIHVFDVNGEYARREKRNQRFIELWNSGAAVTAIADELGLTVDSVYGKAHFLRARGHAVRLRQSRRAAA